MSRKPTIRLSTKYSMLANRQSMFFLYTCSNIWTNTGGTGFGHASIFKSIHENTGRAQKYVLEVIKDVIVRHHNLLLD